MVKAYAALKRGQKLQPFEYNPGELKSNEVEIDVKHCGICHSDLSMLNNEWGLTRYPLVPGHEVTGLISRVGKGVTNLKTGDKVGLGWHSGYCMTCPSCLDGDHNMCTLQEATIVGRYGGFAEKVRAQSESVVPLPDGLDMTSAGPLFCGGITVFNPLLQFDVKPTDRVGVIGIGGLGHMAIMFLNAWGCEVTAFTSSDSKKEKALKMGAHHTINSRNSRELKKVTAKFDFIISTVNVKLDWNTYLETLKPRGRLHIVGATLEPLDIGAFPLIMTQRSVSGSPAGSPLSIAKMLDFAARHHISPIIETFRFEQVNEALEKLASGEVRYRVVLSW